MSLDYEIHFWYYKDLTLEIQNENFYIILVLLSALLANKYNNLKIQVRSANQTLLVSFWRACNLISCIRIANHEFSWQEQTTNRCAGYKCKSNPET